MMCSINLFVPYDKLIMQQNNSLKDWSVSTFSSYGDSSVREVDTLKKEMTHAIQSRISGKYPPDQRPFMVLFYITFADVWSQHKPSSGRKRKNKNIQSSPNSDDEE